MRSFLALFTLAGALLLSFAANAADGDYLFDLIKKPAYRSAWAAMVGGKTRPKWAMQFHKHMNAVAGPATSVTVSGQLYELADICKPHDCGDNQFRVLFLPGGEQAWGALKVAGRPIRFFGDPSPALRNALVAAFGN